MAEGPWLDSKKITKIQTYSTTRVQKKAALPKRRQVRVSSEEHQTSNTTLPTSALNNSTTTEIFKFLDSQKSYFYNSDYNR
jgi:hypothetical protein